MNNSWMTALFISLLLTSANSYATATALYSVPVPSDLASLATFSLQNPEINTSKDGIHSLIFELPKDLTGDVPINVTLEENASSSSSFIPFTSADKSVKAQCLKKKEGYLCLVQYAFDYSSKIKSAKVMQFLQDKYRTDKTSLNQAIKVANIFRAEPEGVLKIRNTLAR